jgi:hypothetical protein
MPLNRRSLHLRLVPHQHLPCMELANEPAYPITLNQRLIVSTDQYCLDGMFTHIIRSSNLATIFRLTSSSTLVKTHLWVLIPHRQLGWGTYLQCHIRHFATTLGKRLFGHVPIWLAPLKLPKRKHQNNLEEYRHVTDLDQNKADAH